MPCYQQQSLPAGVTSQGRVAYPTQADCLNACKEGACCESNGTCNVRPQCQCQGDGQVFRGIGTTCASHPCNMCGISCSEKFEEIASLVYYTVGIASVSRPDFLFVPGESLVCALRRVEQISASSFFAVYSSDFNLADRAGAGFGTDYRNVLAQMAIGERFAEIYLPCTPVSQALVRVRFFSVGEFQSGGTMVRSALHATTEAAGSTINTDCRFQLFANQSPSRAPLANDVGAFPGIEFSLTKDWVNIP